MAELFNHWHSLILHGKGASRFPCYSFAHHLKDRDMIGQTQRQQSSWRKALSMADVIYHTAVRDVRKSHSNALFAILINMLQLVVMVASFYLFFVILGIRQAAIRGDFLLYMMSGIFLFMCHIKAVSAVTGSEGPASPMMKHAPMTTIISIIASLLGAFYIQLISLLTILFLYHVLMNPIEVQDPVGAMAMMGIAFFSGAAVGMCFVALKPWAPQFASILTQIYQRANMIASGKMFVANSLPPFMLSMFDWNPLFHCIDQARGFVFINYNPHNSSITYPIVVALVLLIIGLMGEFFTRKHASASWSARR